MSSNRDNVETGDTTPLAPREQADNGRPQSTHFNPSRPQSRVNQQPSGNGTATGTHGLGSSNTIRVQPVNGEASDGKLALDLGGDTRVTGDISTEGQNGQTSVSGGDEGHSRDPWANSTSPYVNLSGRAKTSNTTAHPTAQPENAYAILFKRPNVGRSERKNRVGVISPRQLDSIELESMAIHIEDSMCALPPVGHHDDFFGAVPRTPKGLFGDWKKDEDEYDTYYDERFQLFDQGTLFSRAFSKFGLDQNVTLSNNENRNDAKNGAKLVDFISKVPLSKAWHIFTEVFFNVIFLTNVAVAMADIIRGPTFLYFKVTTFFLGLVENIVAFVMWAVSKHPKFKDPEKMERYEKYQQYVENVLSETLMYPLLALSILGFTTEKMYNQQSNAFGWIQLVLIIFDTVVLIYGRGVRIYMIRKLLKDITSALPNNEDGTPRSQWKIAGGILWRVYYTIIGNLLVLLALAAMFGLQTNKDNLTTSNYRLTPASGFLLICLILQPIVSLVLFAGANLHWVLEILIELTTVIGNDRDYQESLRDKYGGTVVDTLYYTQHKIPTSEKRLEGLTKTPLGKKLLFSLYEFPILIMLFVWQWLIILTVGVFDGTDDQANNVAIKAAFVVLMVVANPQVSLLMFLSNFMMIAIFVGAIIYPVCIPLCCRKEQLRSTYKQLLSAADNTD